MAWLETGTEVISHRRRPAGDQPYRTLDCHSSNGDYGRRSPCGSLGNAWQAVVNGSFPFASKHLGIFRFEDVGGALERLSLPRRYSKTT